MSGEDALQGAEAAGSGLPVAHLDDDALRSLGELVGDDAEMLAELVDAFLDEAPGRLDELREGLAGGDAVLVERAAHTLKSNGFTFGAHRLGELCQELEATAREGRLGDAEPIAGLVAAEWASVRPALEELRVTATA
jgi:HPt (histidine-containing phosphotransfer) domain-containing protein